MPISTDDLTDALTVREAADLLQLHYRSFHRMLERGELDYVRVGPRKILIPRRSLTEFLNRNHHRAG